MKTKAFFIFSVIAVVGFVANAQPSEDIFDRHEKMVWLGLDFTAAKLVGDHRGWGSPWHTQHVISSLNNLMVRESRKYDIGDALNHYRVQYEIQIAMDHNRRLDMENAVVDRLNGHFLDQNDIQQIVNLYDFNGMQGTGVLFIVETFNKPEMEAIVWATFINLETKKVLLSKKMIEEPIGIGLRNFWAGSIYKMMKQIKKKDYNLWRREYARKK